MSWCCSLCVPPYFPNPSQFSGARQQVLANELQEEARSVASRVKHSRAPWHVLQKVRLYVGRASDSLWDEKSLHTCIRNAAWVRKHLCAKSLKV